jgi:hypothetical protein
LKWDLVYLRLRTGMVNPAVRVQSYAIKSLSDRMPYRTIAANRRKMLPHGLEVIVIPLFHCFFAA